MVIRRLSLVFAVVFAALFIVLFCVSSAFAQGSVPVNGSFTGGRVGWALTYSDPQCYFDGDNGHDALGSVRLGNQNCVLVSLPVRLSSSSVLSFWIKSSGYSTIWYGVYCPDSGVRSSYWNDSSSGSFVNFTRDLSGYAGMDCVLQFWENNNALWLDDVSVSDASNVSAVCEICINGSFDSSAFRWLLNYFADYSVVDGHNAVGSILVIDASYRSAFSMPFLVSSSSWSVWSRRNPSVWSGSLMIRVWDFDGIPGASSVVNVSSLSGDWVRYDFDMSVYLGHRVSFLLSPYGANVDDICPIGGCVVGTPTPVPTYTPTSGYPTQIPYPTVPPYLTQIPYPTQVLYPTQIPYSTQIPYPTLGGGGSTGLCPPNDPCYVAAQTPLPVDLVGVGGTPVSGGGAIPVSIQTPVVTAVAVSSVADGGGLVTVSEPSEYFDSRNVDGHVSVAPLGDTSNSDVSQVVDFRIEQQVLTLCPPPQLSGILSGVSCLVTPVFTFPRFVLAGIDLMPFTTLLLGVLLFVVVMRNVQHN